MELKLDKLVLKYFAGIDEFEFTPNGKNVDIYADNGKGKTRVGVALEWLLTGKNLADQSKFDIKNTKKPLPDGGIEHEVQGFFTFDGKKIVLKKVFREVYTGKRGAAESVFDGHTTDYYIDNMEKPVQEKVYLSELEKICSPTLFQTLTNPAFFNNYYKNCLGEWQGRRELLFKLFGNLTNEQIIDADPELSDLSKILDGKTPEQRREILKPQRNKIDEEIKKIPLQVAENERMKPDVSGLNLEQLQAQLNAANEQLTDKQAELSRIVNGEEIAKKRLELRQIDLEIKNLENTFYNEIRELTSKEESKLNTLVIRSTYDHINNLKNLILKTKGDLVAIEKSRDVLRNKYDIQKSEEFIFNPKFVANGTQCPTCYQSVPPELIEKIKQELLEKFNLAKAEALEAIRTSGKEKNAEIEKLQVAIADLEAKISVAEGDLANYQQQDRTILEDIAKLKDQKINTEVYNEKLSEKERVFKAITELESGNTEVIAKIKEEIEVVNKTVQSINADIGKFDQIDKNNKRIDELKNKQRQLGVEYLECERQLYLIENFIRCKCEMLTDSINSHFEITKWKLFENQVNGGIKEICEATHDGVAYSSNLNDGAKINVGLDCIRAFSNALNIHLPVIIDRCESNTHPIDTGNQQIRLIVSEPDKELRIVYQN